MSIDKHHLLPNHKTAPLYATVPMAEYQALQKKLDIRQEEHRQFYADLWLGEKAVDRTLKTLRELGFQGMSYYEDGKVNGEEDISYEEMKTGKSRRFRAYR